MRTLTIEVSPATYALYRQTLAALSDEAGRPMEECDALATMCHRALEPAGSPPERARYQVAVTVCSSCCRGWQDGAGAVVEIEPADVEVALCDAEHIGSLDAALPSRAHQDVSPATRRLVWRRDHGKCRVAGCRSARNLDVHHVVHREDGGGHEASNLAVLCSGCHTALHRGSIDVSGAAPHFVFRHRDGIELPRETSTPVERDAPPTDDLDVHLEARDCLVTSGYSRSEANAAVDAAVAHVGRHAPLERLLYEAFRRCRVPKS